MPASEGNEPPTPTVTRSRPDRRRPQTATGHALATLDGWRRWCATLTIAALGLLPLAAAGLAASDGWQATGDVAVIGIRSLDAWTGDSPLVGQPTTGEEVSGVPSFHPGPLENWVLGPAVRLVGPQAGIIVGVGLLNGGALAATAWLAFRRGGPVLLTLVALGVGLMVHALGPGSLFDPYNSEVPTYPTVAAVLAAWSVLQRDRRALPVLIGAGSVAAQAHVAGATTIAPVVVATAIALAVQLRAEPALLRRERPLLLGSLILGLLCWSPPLLQELRGPSNLAALWQTAAAEGPSLGLAFALERVATAVAPVPLFARRSGGFGFLADQSALGVLLAAAVIGGGASLALHVRRRYGPGGPARLWAVVALATVVTVVVWSGSPPVSAFRVDTARWLWVSSLLCWVSLVWATWHLVPTPWRNRLQPAAVPIAAVVALATVATSLHGLDRQDVKDGRYMAPVEDLADQVTAALPVDRYHLRFEGAESLVTVGPGLAYHLVYEGYGVVVDPGPFGRGYGPGRTAAGQAVAGTVAVINGAPEVAPGDELLATVRVPDSSNDDLMISVVLER